MNMDLVYKFVKVVFVACTQINKRLNGLVRVCRNFLSLASFYGLDRIIDKHSKVCDAVVHVRRFVNADEWFVKDGKEVAEELEGRRLILSMDVLLGMSGRYAYLFDNLQHHKLISLSQTQLEVLLEMRKELGALSQIFVDLARRISKDAVDAASAVVSAETTSRPHIFDRVVPRNVGIEDLFHLLGAQFRLEELGS